MPTIEDIIKTKSIDDPYLRAMLNVMYTGNWLYQKINSVLKPFDLSEPQYNILRILRGQHGNAIPLFEIQDRMVQQMSNVSRLVEKLHVKGYVERSECNDNRRKVDIKVTEHGLHILTIVEPLLQQLFDSLAQNIKPEEATDIAHILDKYRG